MAKSEYKDPINDMPDSVYLSSMLRTNLDRENPTHFDDNLAYNYAQHLANSSSFALGFARSASMISGFIDHQKGISEPESKFIKVTEVQDLHIIERGNDNLLGLKVQIDFLSAPNKKNSKPDTESISTGWIDYYGYGDTVFEVCLARSIAASLAVLRDMDVDFQMRKRLLDYTSNSSGNQIRPREIADVRPVWDSEADAAVIAQNLEAVIIAVEDSAKAAIKYLKKEDLYDEYYERAFGAPA